jgi:predicted ArsR family transcriptional regulator
MDVARVSTKRNSAARIRHALATASSGLLMSELVASTSLHENAVRRTLAKLIADGAVIVERQPSRARGRPRLRYRLVGTADEPFRQLVPMLLDLIDASGTSAETAYEIGRAHAERASARTFANTREAITESLVRLGFAPIEQSSTSTERTVLDLTRCPFSTEVVAARPEGRQICQLHHGFLAGVAEAADGVLDEFKINDPRALPCRVVFHAVGQQTTVPA